VTDEGPVSIRPITCKFANIVQLETLLPQSEALIFAFWLQKEVQDVKDEGLKLGQSAQAVVAKLEEMKHQVTSHGHIFDLIFV